MSPEATRRKLVEAAKAELLEHGYRKASVRRICAAAGLTTGALYHFFGNKEHLLDAVVEPAVCDIAAILGTPYISQTGAGRAEVSSPPKAPRAQADSTLAEAMTTKRPRRLEAPSAPKTSKPWEDPDMLVQQRVLDLATAVANDRGTIRILLDNQGHKVVDDFEDELGRVLVTRLHELAALRNPSLTRTRILAPETTYWLALGWARRTISALAQARPKDLPALAHDLAFSARTDLDRLLRLAERELDETSLGTAH